LRRWEREGRGVPFQKTAGGQRRYDLAKLHSQDILQSEKSSLTLAYARVSCHDQKKDLQRQEKMLEMFCATHGWSFELISDLGSGMNYNKRGLKKLINKILNGEIKSSLRCHKKLLKS
jgi:putative resolvase